MTHAEQLAHSRSIDIALSVLDIVRPKGVPIPGRVIADICGCSYNNIYLIEQRAIEKIKSKLADHADYIGDDINERHAQSNSLNSLHGANQ